MPGDGHIQAEFRSAEALGAGYRSDLVQAWALAVAARADCAAMDGIAVRAADLAGTGGETADGTVRLPGGTFHWIDTGGPAVASGLRTPW